MIGWSMLTCEAQCISTRGIRYRNRALYAGCAADVITDCLSKLSGWANETGSLLWMSCSPAHAVISIPVLTFWHIHIPLRQKSILLAILLLAVAVMIISILRVAAVNSIIETVEFSWLYLWSSTEMSTGTCLPAIPTHHKSAMNYPPTDPATPAMIIASAAGFHQLYFPFITTERHEASILHP